MVFARMESGKVLAFFVSKVWTRETAWTGMSDELREDPRIRTLQLLSTFEHGAQPYSNFKNFE